MLSTNEQTVLLCIFVHESSPEKEKKKNKICTEGIEKKNKISAWKGA